MNLKIEVPANLEPLLRRRAAQAGVPVESFVLQAVTEHLAVTDAPRASIGAEDFSAWLRQWAAQFPKLEHAIEDSRESIYTGRS
jgi:hypothetical protein